MNSPRTENGGSIVRSPTPGPALFVNCVVKDQNGKPISGAEVDIWHSSPEGFYEQQDPKQAPMNLRGKFMEVGLVPPHELSVLPDDAFEAVIGLNSHT